MDFRWIFVESRSGVKKILTTFLLLLRLWTGFMITMNRCHKLTFGGTMRLLPVSQGKYGWSPILGFDEVQCDVDISCVVEQQLFSLSKLCQRNKNCHEQLLCNAINLTHQKINFSPKISKHKFHQTSTLIIIWIRENVREQ